MTTMGGDQPIVLLSDYWIAKATAVGIARNNYADGVGYQNYGQLMHGTTEQHHIDAAIGECSTAKFFQLPWKANIGVIDGIDVGDLIDVRTRRPARGMDLTVRPRDHDDRPYVLTYIGDDKSIRLVGWLFGREGKGAGIWFANMGVWFVSPPLRPISELEEWVRTNRHDRHNRQAEIESAANP